MIDTVLTASSDAFIALTIAVPVVVVATGAALVLRSRAHRPPGDTTVRPATKPRPPAKPAPKPGPEPAVRPPASPRTASTVQPGALVGVEPEVPVDVEPEAVEPEAVEPPTYRGRLGKARGLLAGYLGSVRSKGKIDTVTWDDLEEALIRADVGVGATDALLDDLRARVRSGDITDADALIDALKGDLVAVLSASRATLALPGSAAAAGSEKDGGEDGEAVARTVDVWLFVGVNGVGKTTTVGKVANRLAADGASVLLAAGDTFRAAAGEQLDMWAARSGADIVRGAEGGDPSAVVFDAVQRAASRGHQVVLADTAGRLHNKVNLVEELKKIRRVADRPPGRVVEVLLVLDATTGQNGLAQAKVFTDAVDATGVVLTKLDGTAKGGIVVAIQRELGLPVKLVGLGEGIGDLIDFDPAAFVDALF